MSSKEATFHSLNEKLEASLIFIVDFNVGSMKYQYMPSSNGTLKLPEVVLGFFRQVGFNFLKVVSSTVFSHCSPFVTFSWISNAVHFQITATLQDI